MNNSRQKNNMNGSRRYRQGVIYINPSAVCLCVPGIKLGTVETDFLSALTIRAN